MPSSKTQNPSVLNSNSSRKSIHKPLSAHKPVVGVICDIHHIGNHDYHAAGDKYLQALCQAADVVPVLIPAMAEAFAVERWLDRVDGVFLTGAYSMAQPSLYGESPADPDYFFDPQRDAQSLALIHAVRQQNKPLMGVCRGLQDINVALGGSLHQAVHKVAGMNDHREDNSKDLDQQYAPAHSVNITEGGLLQRITGQSSLIVNSLHSQGIHRLADDLTAEATAEDGLVEAVSIKGMAFALAVQWHPEWKVMDNPIQKSLYQAFGEACRTLTSR